MNETTRRVVTQNVAATAAARRCSRFGDGDDRLSKACSAVLRIREAHAEAIGPDAEFDGGEFSIPAHAMAEASELERVAIDYSGDNDVAAATAELFAAVDQRLSAKASAMLMCGGRC